MANEDEVLSLNGEDSDFSGFDPQDLPENESVVGPSASVSKPPKGKKGKGKQHANPKLSVNPKTTKKQAKKSAPSASTSSTSTSFQNLVENLTDEDIVKLKELLGFNEFYDYNEEENLHNLFGCSWDDKPGLTVELTDESVGELPVAAPVPAESSNKTKRNPLQPVELSQNMINAMFEGSSDYEAESTNQNEEVWDLPKTKGPEKGPAISQSLANLINTVCTSQFETEKIVEKYKIPSNCDKLPSPLVNNEIWKLMTKPAQSYDKNFAEIQNLVATSVVPIMDLFRMVRPHFGDSNEARTLFSDVITLLGQVQFQLSIKRRYLIRPVLKKKYHGLCNISTPISTKLFGDDSELTKSVKNCDTSINVGKENYNSNNQGYYGGNYRPYKPRGSLGRGANRGARFNYRYQAYPNMMYGYGNGYSGYGGMYRGDYGMYHKRGFLPRQRFSRGRKQTPSATVTSAPNESA